MRNMWEKWLGISVCIMVWAEFSILLTSCSSSSDTKRAAPVATQEPVQEIAKADAPETPPVKTLEELVKEYGDLPLIDSHNHDASGSRYRIAEDSWKQYGVDQVVLFGDVSEFSAINTDEVSWKAYQADPERIIPFTSGINLLDKSGLDMAKANLEKGYFGIGEIAAASTFSPVLSKVEWKTQNPMDGILPQLYELAAKYKVPFLLHIDPPNGAPIAKLEEALDKYPDTTIIFGHGNAYNSPENLDALLQKHPNLYVDFFAGFTAFNPESSNKLEDFVPVMKKFPDKFMLSTDAGYGLPGGETQAIEGMYRLIDALGDRKLAQKIAHDNLYGLISRQPATRTQVDRIKKSDSQTGKTRNYKNLSKVEAGLILSGKEK